MSDQLMPTKKMLDEIDELFQRLSFYIENEIRRGRSEITFLSELLLEELLNEVYKERYVFKNLNFKKSNYPAIDLGDETNGISFQITVTNEKNRVKEKIDNTLEKFFEHNLDQTYSKLFIFIASGYALNNDLGRIKDVKSKKEGKNEDTLFSYKNVWDFSNLYREIVENFTTIDLKKVIEICKKVEDRPVRRIFEKPKYHIPRTVSGNFATNNIIEILKSNKRIVLVGEGGMGKTTELLYVVNILSNENWFCGFISLVDYAISLEKTINTYFKNWINCYEANNMLIVLDGLDEIANENDSIVNEIIQFGIDYPHIHLLVSHKEGYQYDLRPTSPVEKNQEIFNPIRIVPIAKESLVEFINEQIQTPELLMQQLEENELLSLCSNPFYLISLIELFELYGLIPLDNVELMEKLIECRIQHENKKKGKFSGKLKDNEFEVHQCLTWLAVVLQYAGKVTISNRDFQQLVQKKGIRALTKRIIVYENCEWWKFEHSLFRDFLAAKALIAYKWDKMKEIILTKNGKVKSRWNNTYYFLLMLASKKKDSELLKQLNQVALTSDYSKLLKHSNIHLTLPEKNGVFHSIYNDYKTKQIVFYVEFSAQELANFCQLGENQDLIDFLLSELMPEMNIQNLYNIVGLFKGSEIENSSTKNKIANALIPYLLETKYNTYSINPTILELLTNWEWSSEPFIEKAIQNEVLIADGSIRSSFLWYLISINYQSIPAELVLQCMKVRENDSVMTSDIFVIKQVVSILSVSELTCLLDNLTLSNEGNEKRRIKNDFMELAKSIEERASELYPDYPEILKFVKQFVIASIKYYKYESAQAIKPFFIKCGILFSEFIEAFENEKKDINENRMNQFTYSGYLADAECIEWIIKEYEAHNIQDTDINELLFSMQITRNAESRRLLNEKINEKTNGKFLPPPGRYDEAQKQSNKLYAEAILNRSLFVNYIEKAFLLYGKEELTSDEYWHEYDRDEDLFNANYIVARECLKDFIENDKTTKKQDVLDLLSDNNYWNELQLDEHYNILGNEFLPDDNIQWIEKWCRENELLIDFQNAFAKGCDIENHNKALYYLGFVLSLDYIISDKDILQEMVSCLSSQFKSKRKNTKTDSLKSLYEYLQEHLTNDEINDKIVENIAEGIDTDYILDEHIQIVEREQLSDAVQYLPKYILNENLHKHHRLRALKTYFLLNGYVDNVKSLLKELQFTDEFAYDWYIVDEFAKQDKKLTSEKLMDFWENDKINKNKLAIALIKCGRIEGLNLLHQIIKGRNDNGKFDEFRMGLFETFVREGDFNGKETVPILTDLILVHLQPEFINDEWGNVISQLFNLLIYFFSKGNMEMWADTESLIADSLSKSDNTPNYQIISRSFQSLRMSINVQMDSECEIEDAIKKLELILKD